MCKPVVGVGRVRQTTTDPETGDTQDRQVTPKTKKEDTVLLERYKLKFTFTLLFDLKDYYFRQLQNSPTSPFPSALPL